jgi:hypothetical protein
MSTAVTAMTMVIATWVVLTAASVGIGALVLRACGVGLAGTDRLLMAAVLGLCAELAWLQLWHFWWPINMAAGVSCLVAGAVGLLLARREVAAWVRRVAERPGMIAFAALTLVWLANHALGPGDAIDSGAYQYHVVRWSAAYPLVPGLANLDYLLAFSNSSLLLHAAIDTAGSPWAGRANHVGNGVILMPLVGLVVSSVGRLVIRWRARIDVTPEDVCGAVCLVPLFMLSLSRELTSPRTDLPTAVLAFFVVWRLLALLRSRDAVEQRVNVIFITMCAATLPTMKLSLAAFGLGAWVTAVMVWLRAARPTMRQARAVVATCVVVSAVIAGAWLVRGYVLSGFPLFPSSVLSQQVDWRMSDQARHEWESAVLDWPTVAQPRFAATTVFLHAPEWLIRMLNVDPSRDESGPVSRVVAWAMSSAMLWPIEIVAPVLLALVALGLARRGATSRNGPSLWPAAIPPVAGVVFWLATAPLPRYGYAAMWALSAVVVAIAWSRVRQRWGRHVVVGLLIAFVAAVVAHRILANAFLYKVPVLSRVFWVPSGPDRGFHPRPPTLLEPVTNSAGVTIHVPVSGGLLWNAPLMSTHTPSAVEPLRLRVEGDIASGFRSAQR